MGFPFFLFFPLCSRCFFPPIVPDHVELYEDIAQTELLCSIAGPKSRSPSPPFRAEMHRRMEIALGTSSFVVWTEKLMVAFRDCKDHVDYMSQVDKWATSHFAQMLAHLPTLPSRSVQTEGLARPSCQLRHITGLPACPRHTARFSPASFVSYSTLDFFLYHFYF